LTKKFARCFVISRAVTNVLVCPYLPSAQRVTRETRRLAPRLGQREKKMKTTILTIAGAALIALSTVQFAAASEQQNRVHHRAHASAQYRDTNASAAPAEWAGSGYSYGGGISAPAGR
jgi:hypothetical protein